MLPSTSRSLFVSHGMSNTESWALDAKGKLMDVSEIIWYKDHDDTQPPILSSTPLATPQAATSRGSGLKGKEPAFIVARKRKYHQSDIWGPGVLDIEHKFDIYMFWSEHVLNPNMTTRTGPPEQDHPNLFSGVQVVFVSLSIINLMVRVRVLAQVSKNQTEANIGSPRSKLLR